MKKIIHEAVWNKSSEPVWWFFSLILCVTPQFNNSHPGFGWKEMLWHLIMLLKHLPVNDGKTQTHCLNCDSEQDRHETSRLGVYCGRIWISTTLLSEVTDVCQRKWSSHNAWHDPAHYLLTFFNVLTLRENKTVIISGFDDPRKTRGLIQISSAGFMALTSSLWNPSLKWKLNRLYYKYAEVGPSHK